MIFNLSNVNAFMFQALASLLFEAASECHCVDPDKVRIALTPSKQDLAPMLKWVHEVTEGQLSLQQISHIAAVISARDMVTIAEGYMDISHETVRTLQYENKESPDKFKRQIIDTWCKTNPDINQTKVCAKFLQHIE